MRRSRESEENNERMLARGTKVYTVIDEYVIEKQIDQGGNGTIYRVHNSSNNLYALKAIDRNKTTKNKLKRFRNEISFCKSADNPHVIRVLDDGTFEDSIIFYIMPLYEKTLRELMNEGLEPEKCFSLITQILDGLKYAHEKNVWHRDIKPENILVGSDGTVVIADFGIAHFSEDFLQTVVDTKPTDRLANFQYAAPEQRERGREVDGRADVYSLGLLINELFTHELPLGENYKRIGSVCPDFSFLDSVVSEMREQDVETRLYPINKVATHILAAKQDWEQSQELLALSQETDSDETPYQISSLSISGYELEDGWLTLEMSGIDNEKHFDKWFRVLQDGNYSRTSVWGFGPERLRNLGFRKVGLSISSLSQEQLNKTISYFKEWMESARVVFNREVSNEFERKRRELEMEKRSEILRLKKEAEMREMVRSILDNHH